MIHLKVKFRAFGITFGNIDRTFPLDLLHPLAAQLPPFPKKTLVNERGVLLEVWKD